MEKDGISDVKNAEDLVKDLSLDYSTYLETDTENERFQFDESIEEMLTKLDEYCGLVDMIRSDSTQCLHRTIPAIQKKGEDMQKVFDRIDQLEAFVALVKQSMNSMETHLEKAESELGATSSIKKVLSSLPLPSLFSTKKQTQKRENSSQPQAATSTFTPPQIFSTKDLLYYEDKQTKNSDSVEGGSSDNHNVPDSS